MVPSIALFFAAMAAGLAQIGHNHRSNFLKRPDFPLFTGLIVRNPGFSAGWWEPLPHGHSEQSGFLILTDLG